MDLPICLIQYNLVTFLLHFFLPWILAVIIHNNSNPTPSGEFNAQPSNWTMKMTPGASNDCHSYRAYSNKKTFWEVYWNSSCVWDVNYVSTLNGTDSDGNPEQLTKQNQHGTPETIYEEPLWWTDSLLWLQIQGLELNNAQPNNLMEYSEGLDRKTASINLVRRNKI